MEDEQPGPRSLAFRRGVSAGCVPEGTRRRTALADDTINLILEQVLSYSPDGCLKLMGNRLPRSLDPRSHRSILPCGEFYWRAGDPKSLLRAKAHPVEPVFVQKGSHPGVEFVPAVVTDVFAQQAGTDSNSFHGKKSSDAGDSSWMLPLTGDGTAPLQGSCPLFFMLRECDCIYIQDMYYGPTVRRYAALSFVERFVPKESAVYVRAICLILCVLSLPLLAQSTIRVPQDVATIQQAIAMALSGDTILVGPGTYQAANLDFSSREIILRSKEGAAVTTIDAGGTGRHFYFHMGEGPSTLVEGFTLTGGQAVAGESGGSIRVAYASPTISNCIIHNCAAGDGAGYGNGVSHGGDGGAIHCSAGAITVTGCVITGNSAGAGGYGFQLGGNGGNGGGIAVDGGASALVYNTIIRGNNVGDAGQSLFGNSGMPGLGADIRGTGVALAHCNVVGVASTNGNMDADPKFVDAANGDYHLLVDSPCINTGLSAAPALAGMDYDGEPRILGTSVDIGADEFASLLTGTGEDFVMISLINGSGNPNSGQKIVHGGDIAEFRFWSPNGTFNFAAPLLVAQATAFGAPDPPSPMGFPTIHVNPFGAVIIYNSIGGPLGPAVLPPSGITLNFAVPVYMANFDVRVQAMVGSNQAANGILASSDCHELEIHP